MKTNKNYLLSKAQCNALRGIAILGIMFHNYAHWLPGIVRENEFTFTQEHFNVFLNSILNIAPRTPLHIISFLGHYGVPIFLFLSGFGLVMKYEKNNFKHQNISKIKFITQHFMKLLIMMLPAYIIYIVLSYLFTKNFSLETINVIAQIGMFNNFMPNPSQIINPGPYWYFGLTLQLYFVYILFVYRKNNSILFVVIILSAIIQHIFQNNFDTLEYIRYNFIGAVLPFSLGIMYARYGKDFNNKIYFVALIISITLIIILSSNVYSWFYVPIFIIISTISLIKLLPQKLMKPLSFIGLISSSIFVLHPIVRQFIIWKYARTDVYMGILIYGIITLTLSLIYFYVSKTIKGKNNLIKLR